MSTNLAPKPAGSAGSEQRRRILEAAIGCFASAGFHGTSMHEICSAAQMSPGALYRYFPSKEAIIEAIAESEREQNAAYFQRLEVETGVLANFLDVGIAYLRDMVGSPMCALCAEVRAEAQRNPRVRAMFERNHQDVRSRFRAMLERARTQGEIARDVDLDVVVTLLLAMGDGLLSRMPFDPEMAPDRIEAGLKELVLRMLAPRVG